MSLLMLRWLLNLLLAHCLHHLQVGVLTWRLYLLQRLQYLWYVGLLVESLVDVALRHRVQHLLALSGCRDQLGRRLRWN